MQCRRSRTHAVSTGQTDFPVKFHGENTPALPGVRKGKSGRLLRRPQPDHPAATVDEFCTAVLTMGVLALSGCLGSDSPTADTVVVGDILFYASGQRGIRVPSSCSGARCTLTYQGESVTFDVREIDPRSTVNVRITGAHVRNGVQVARGRFSDQGVHFDMWGTSATYSAAVSGQGQTTIQGVPVGFVIPISVGEGSGTNPVSGSAIWTGAMAGTRVSGASPGPAVTGDARMQIDFSDVSLDLEFTQIAEISSGGVPSADALEMAQKELEIAEEYMAKLDARTVKGSSMLARANAQKVLDARDAVTIALAAAKAALTMAENARTELGKLETEAMTAGDAPGLEAVRISLARAEQDVMDAQQAVTAAAAIADGDDLTRAVEMVTGNDDEEPIAAFDGDTVAEEVEDNWINSATFLNALAPAEAVATGDFHKGMTFEEIAMAQGDLFSEQIIKNKLSPAVSLDGEIIPAGLLEGAVVTPVGTSVAHTWKGIKGTAYCRSDGCDTSDIEFAGGWYFTAVLMDDAGGEAPMYYLKDGDDYTAELYAKYGSWFETDTTNFKNFAAAVATDIHAGDAFKVTEDADLAGSATYTGTAGGLSVHREFDKGVATSVESGVFTADISLTATFGLAPKLKGEVSNFGGDAVDEDWTIKLAEKALAGSPFQVTEGEIEGDGGWNAIPYGADAAARPDGFFGGFNANFSNGGVSGSYAASK